MKNKMYKRIAISEIGSIVSGATPKTSDATNYGGDIPWLTPADLSGYTNKYIERGARNISKKGYDSCSTQIMPAGSILFSSRAPIGYVAIAANPICTNQGFKSIVPNKNIDSEFLYYQLKFLKNQIADLGRGTTFKEISGKTLGSVEIVLPDLKEQKRIVNKIEELFSELDSAVETLKKTKEQLAVYRQSVLKEAFESITETSILVNLAERIFDGPFGSNLKSIDYINEGIRVVRLENLKEGWFDDSKQSFVSNEKYETIKKHTVYPSDLIMSTFISDSIKVCQMPEYIKFAVNKADCIGIRLKEDVVEKKYVLYYLLSRKAYVDLEHQIHGATRPRVNTTQIKQLEIPICSKKEQKKIVSQIEAKFTICENIEKTVNDALSQADAMRQSILKKAFEGGL